jgi:hypothetical protein
MTMTVQWAWIRLPQLSLQVLQADGGEDGKDYAIGM